MARTRSRRAHADVLTATLQLIAERGIDATSVDAIAEVSGVSKATIYKHWTTKEALCLEAIGSANGELPQFDSGEPRTDLVNLLRHVVQHPLPAAMGKLWARVIGHAAGNPAFGDALRARFDQPRRTQVTRLVKAAVEQGRLRPDVDLDLATDMLFGPIMYRRFTRTPMPSDFAERLVMGFWNAWSRNTAAAHGTVDTN